MCEDDVSREKGQLPDINMVDACASSMLVSVGFLFFWAQTHTLLLFHAIIVQYATRLKHQVL